MPKRDKAAAFQRDHDHARCVRRALEAAAAHCDAEGVRLTPLRRKVLEAVWQSHTPLGAYEICERLVDAGDAVLPPTVYRALRFLERHGLAHRIPSLNAFIGCNQPGRHRDARYLICSDCGLVAELPAAELSARMAAEAAGLDFEPASVRVEAVGRCGSCAEKAGARP